MHRAAAISAAARAMSVSARLSASAASSSPEIPVPCDPVSLCSYAVSARETADLADLDLGRIDSGRSSSRTRHARATYSSPSRVFSCFRVTRVSHSSRKKVNAPSARNLYSGGTDSMSASVFVASAVIFSSPSKSNSSSLSSSSSPSVSACFLMSERSTRRLSDARVMIMPASTLASGRFVSKS